MKKRNVLFSSLIICRSQHFLSYSSISEVNIFCPFSMGSCYMTLTHSCCVLASADECNMHAHRRWIAAGAAYWPPKQEGNINGLCSFGPGLCLLMHTFPTDCAGQGFTLRTTIASNLFHIPDQSCSKSDDVTIELLSMRPLVFPFLFYRESDSVKWLTTCHER